MKYCLLKHAQEGYVSHLAKSKNFHHNLLLQNVVKIVEYRMIRHKQPKISGGGGSGGGGSASCSDISSERRLLVLNMFAQYHLRFIKQKLIH